MKPPPDYALAKAQLTGPKQPGNTKSLFDDFGISLGFAAFFFAVGTISIVGFLTWCAIPFRLGESEISVAALGLVTIGVIALLVTIPLAVRVFPKLTWGVDSVGNYGRCLVGVGYFLLVDAIANLVAFAGFANGGYFDLIFPVGNGFGLFNERHGQDQTFVLLREVVALILGVDERQHLLLAVILMLSLGMAVLGALFFFANSLWDKLRHSEGAGEPFDPRIFWAGLWFRLAESIIFTIALFLLLTFQGAERAVYYLPFFALFIGMSVKSAETLFAGIFLRLFAAMSAMVGSQPASTPSTSPAPAAAATPVLSILRDATRAHKHLSAELFSRIDFAHIELLGDQHISQFKIPMITPASPSEHPRIEQEIRVWLGAVIEQFGQSSRFKWKATLGGKQVLTVELSIAQSALRTKAN